MPQSEPTQPVPAFVASVSPLTIRSVGAETACPAATIAGQTYHVGDPVTATPRTPNPPLVQGVVSS